MHFLKKYPKLVKFTCLATLSYGAGWLCYQVKTTQQILTLALDTSVLTRLEPTAVEVPNKDDFFIIDFPPDAYGQTKSFSGLWTSLKFSLAKRLLVLANSENGLVRRRAVRQLAKVRNLYSWQYAQLAYMIDARTAVGLARTHDVDHRLFINPPSSYVGHTNEMLVDVMKDLLNRLQEVSKHKCMEYFVSKAFGEDNDLEKNTDEYSSFELKKHIQSNDEILPMCLESLVHHASLANYAKHIATLNGLPLLMEIYNRFKDNIVVTSKICRIMSYLSIHGELLHDLHATGWITMLAQWINHEDVRIAIPAAKALANLDSDDPAMYLHRLYPLHPSIRHITTPQVDVIFVHGLLGGVFFTWRQRQRGQTLLGLFGKKGPRESVTSNAGTSEIKNSVTKRKNLESSDPVVREFMHDLEDHLSSEAVCKDFEVVLEDIPTNTNEAATGPYSCTGHNLHSFQSKHDDAYTFCWARDWLAEDCDRLRIIGVNYESNLSLWTPICPIENAKTIEGRSLELMEQLLRIDVGNRPIVWITHSMGGLIAKHLLNKASKSDDKQIKNIYLNTKGIIFYSTPHIGSSLAKFNPASALLIWPSIEVQELKRDSPPLVQLHQEFLELVKQRPIKVVTFLETQPTVVSAMKFKFLMVEPESGNPGCGEYYEIPLDHLGICKPVARFSFIYQKVLHTIRDILTNEQTKT